MYISYILFLMQHLTGGPNGGRHVTDVTNASRTMLMHINKLEWDFELCRYEYKELQVPELCLYKKNTCQ